MITALLCARWQMMRDQTHTNFGGIFERLLQGYDLHRKKKNTDDALETHTPPRKASPAKNVSFPTHTAAKHDSRQACFRVLLQRLWDLTLTLDNTEHVLSSEQRGGVRGGTEVFFWVYGWIMHGAEQSVWKSISFSVPIIASRGTTGEPESHHDRGESTCSSSAGNANQQLSFPFQARGFAAVANAAVLTYSRLQVGSKQISPDELRGPDRKKKKPGVQIGHFEWSLKKHSGFLLKLKACFWDLIDF